MGPVSLLVVGYWLVTRKLDTVVTASLLKVAVEVSRPASWLATLLIIGSCCARTGLVATPLFAIVGLTCHM